MYQVSMLNDIQELKNRDRAIEIARELSEGNRRQVEVEGRGELLVYVQGDLKTYRFRAN